MRIGQPPGQRVPSRAFSWKKPDRACNPAFDSRKRDHATMPERSRFRVLWSRYIEQAYARMQNRSPIMLNAIEEGTSKAEPGCGGKCRYGASGFFPVPLQGTQTLR
jgi:hypothetical protein